MSKWITLLLAIVVIASSIVPCCAKDDCADEASSCSTSEHPFEQKGACSPFATCGSCTGFAPVTRTAIQLSLPVTYQTIHHEKYIGLLPSAYQPALFQPPRA